MAVDTKPNLSCEKFEQWTGDTLNLSGSTDIYGIFKIANGASFCMSENAGNGKVITSDSLGRGTWQTISAPSGGAGDRITKQITQTSHGFVVGDVVGFSGGTYTKAIADGSYDGEVLGIVSECLSSSIFNLTQAGYVTGLTSLTASTTYFLSDTVAGALISTKPINDGYIVKSVLVADSTTSGYVLPYPSYYVSTGTTTITGADNGLSVNGTTIELGGTLCCNTSITTDGYTLSLLGLPAKTTETCVIYIDASGALSTGVTTGGGSGSGERITKSISQANSFAVGDVIGFSGGTYTKAIADGVYDGEIIGVVSKTGNPFELTQSGYVTGLTGLITGCTYFLSPSTAGSITTNEPTGDTQISKAVLLATSASEGWVLPYPGYVVATGQTGGGTWGTITGTLSDQTDLWGHLTYLSGQTDTKLNISTFTGYTASTTNGIAWSGTTACGIGTYIDANTIRSESNFIFDRTTCVLTITPGDSSNPTYGSARLGMANFAQGSAQESDYLYTGSIVLGLSSGLGSYATGFASKSYRGNNAEYTYTHIVVTENGYLYSKYGANGTDSTAASTGTWHIHPYVTNNADNYLLTATGGGDINGEANLTFDGTRLVVTGCACITALPAKTGETNVVYYNPANGLLSYGAGGGGTITGATNGLTVYGANIGLGGTLTGSTIITDSRVTPTGIEYGSDYSANYSNRSLVDKEYVDKKLSGSTLNIFTITGDDTTTGFTINHNLNQQFVGVEIVEAQSPFATVYTDVSRPDANSVCVTFDAAPATGTDYKVLIIMSGGSGGGTYATLDAQINDVTGTTYSLQLSDRGKVIEFTNSGATTITLPTGLTTGFQAVLVNVGGSNKTLSAGSGATLYTLNSNVIIAGAYNAATVYYRGANNWVGFGNLS